MVILFDIYMEDLVDLLICEEIKRLVYECKDLGVKLKLSRPFKLKSKKIDEKMEFLMDKMVCEELLMCGSEEGDKVLLESLILLL
jgi:hypothetical protein